MSEALQNAIAALETELEAIDQKRSDIEHSIRSLTRLVEQGVTSNGRGRPKKAKADRQPARAKRQEKVASRPAKPARKTERPPVEDDRAPAILATLERKGPLSPGDLAKALGVDPATCRKALKPLVKAGKVEVTGNTIKRQVRLPSSKKTAKEGP